MNRYGAHLPTSFPPGDTIVREGEPGSSAFILLSGSCDVTVHGDVLGVVSPGELFGDIACLEGGTRTATIRATSTSDVLEIAGDALRVELRRSPPCSIGFFASWRTACATSLAARRPRETSIVSWKGTRRTSAEARSPPDQPRSLHRRPMATA